MHPLHHPGLTALYVYSEYLLQVLEPLCQRRAHLLSQWNFHCCCPRCLDTSAAGSLAALVCLSCKDVILPPSVIEEAGSWQCQGCRVTITDKEAEARLEKVTATLNKVSKSDVKKLESFLGAAQCVLHPRNSLLLGVKRNLFGLYGSAPGYSQAELTEVQVTRKLMLGEEYLEAVGRVDPGLTRWRGQILYEMNKFKIVKIMQALQKRQIGIESFLEQATIIVKELEEAVAGMTGERVEMRGNLKARLVMLSKTEVLGQGYAQLLGMIVKLPFIS